MMYFTKEDLSDLIVLLRPLLIMLVCWAHIPFIYGYASSAVSTDEYRTLLGVFFRDVFSRGAVPLLTVISGYLAYRSYQRYSYTVFALKKANRILFPFVLWNLLALMVTWVLYHWFGAVQVVPKIGQVEGADDMVRAVLGINQLPINLPLYFLRDLFLISLLCPLFNLLARHYLPAALFIIFYGVFMFHHVSPHLFGYGVLYRSDMPLFFFAGYLFARSGLPLPRVSAKTSALGLAFLLVLSVWISWLLATNKPDLIVYLEYRPIIGIVFLALLPCIGAILMRWRDSTVATFLQRISPYAFVVFLSHYVLILSFSAWVATTGFNVSNLSSVGWQVIFLVLYTAACLGCGVLVRMVYRIPLAWLRPNAL